jgi:hypothetical protein
MFQVYGLAERLPAILINTSKLCTEVIMSNVVTISRALSGYATGAKGANRLSARLAPGA